MEFTSAQLTSIIIAVITSTISLIGAIVSAILIYKARIRTPPDDAATPPTVIKGDAQDKEPSKKAKKIYIALLVIFLAAAVPGINIIRRDYYSPYISITDPQNDQSGTGTIAARGNYRNIDENRLAIWIAVYSYKDHLFFLQDRPADMILEDQVWDNKEIMIGAGNQKGGKFDIMILLVDRKSKAYTDIQKYVKSVSYQGLPALPDGVQVMKEITISQK